MDRSWSGSLRASVTPISFEALDACVPRGELAIEALQAGGVDLPGSHWDHYNGAAAGRRTADLAPLLSPKQEHISESVSDGLVAMHCP
jgi:hypothetical protein